MFNKVTMKQFDTMWTLGAQICRPCFFPVHKNNAAFSGDKINSISFWFFLNVNFRNENKVKDKVVLNEVIHKQPACLDTL